MSKKSIEREPLRRIDVSRVITDWDGETPIPLEGADRDFTIKDAIMKIANHAHLCSLSKEDKGLMIRLARINAKCSGNLDLTQHEYDVLKRITDAGTFTPPGGNGQTPPVSLFGLCVESQVQEAVNDAVKLGSEEKNGQTNRITQEVTT